MTIEERCKKILIEHLGQDEYKVIDSAKIVDDLGADSLDKVELVMAFEDEFDVDIPDEKFEELITVGDAISLINEMVPK